MPKRRSSASTEDDDILRLVEDEGQPSPTAQVTATGDEALSRHYEATEFKIIQERNDFLLHQILDFVNARRWINLTPEYQRRKRWDNAKKSLLIESLLMNLPVPPIFLYEIEPARYEVMDGQQRLSAIIEFYNDDLVLNALETWPGLNGRTYRQCPARIRRGIDRRRISAVILTADTGTTAGLSSTQIRREVFERLNTGGEKLNAQELRNCLYSGTLNSLVLELSRSPNFTSVWHIPPYGRYEKGRSAVIEPRKSHALYKTMADNQIVLRFFAFRKRERLKGSVRSILDPYMSDRKDITETRAAELKGKFLGALKLASDIFGDNTFALPGGGSKKRSVPLYDAVMIALDREIGNARSILRAKRRIVADLEAALGSPKSYEVLIGRPNTAAAIEARIDRVQRIIQRAIA
jgi:hypothetical protein